jgi:hypothetical protein
MTNPAGFPGLHLFAVFVAICALTATACGAPCKCAASPTSPEAGDAADDASETGADASAPMPHALPGTRRHLASMMPLGCAAG